MPNHAPVTVVAPSVASRPKWLDPAIAAAAQNPRHFNRPWVESFQNGGLWGQDPQKVRLVADAAGTRRQTSSVSGDGSVGISPATSELGPSQFGWAWEGAEEKFMPWIDLWELCRDADTRTPRARQASEEACAKAILRFGSQGGRDPWGFSFDSSFDEATTLSVVAKETGKAIVFHAAGGLTGNRLLHDSWGPLHRSATAASGGRARAPTLHHVLVGGGYGLAHLLVVKNLPRALECLLAQFICTPTSLDPGKKAVTNMNGGAVEVKPGPEATEAAGASADPTADGDSEKERAEALAALTQGRVARASANPAMLTGGTSAWIGQHAAAQAAIKGVERTLNAEAQQAGSGGGGGAAVAAVKVRKERVNADRCSCQKGVPPVSCPGGGLRRVLRSSRAKHLRCWRQRWWRWWWWRRQLQRSREEGGEPSGPGPGEASDVARRVALRR